MIGFHPQELLPPLVAGRVATFRNFAIVSESSVNTKWRTVTEFILELTQARAIMLEGSITGFIKAIAFHRRADCRRLATVIAAISVQLVLLVL